MLDCDVRPSTYSSSRLPCHGRQYSIPIEVVCRNSSASVAQQVEQGRSQPQALICKSCLNKRLENGGCCVACMAQMRREWLCLWMCNVPEIARLQQEQQWNAIHRSPNSQCSLYLFFDSPVLGHICVSHRWKLLPLWVVALRSLSALLGGLRGNTSLQPCSSTVSQNSNMVLSVAYISKTSSKIFAEKAL